MPTVEPQMLRGVLALLLLQLCGEREDYGYSLVQRLRAAGLVEAAEGSVYPALARLESRGLLEPRMVREGRGPGRRYYSVTGEGADETARLRSSWVIVADVVRRVAEPADVDAPTGAGAVPEPSREGTA